MQQIPIPSFTEWLFTSKPFQVLDSGHRLHFYFNTPYGITSCSYTKLALIDILYNHLIQRKQQCPLSK